MKSFIKLRAWILIPFAVVAFVVFVAYKQHRAADKYESDRQSWCAALPASAQEKEASCADKGPQRDSYLPWGYKLIAWPEGMTTWAIVATGFVIAWQSYETRRAANMAQITNNVARNKDKPRISITIDSVNRGIPNPSINFSATFRCPTPAYIKSAATGAFVWEKINPRPPYGLSSFDIPSVIEGSVIYPDRAKIFGKEGFNKLSSATLEQLETGEIDLLFVAHVIFEDVYGRRDFMFSKIYQATQLKNFDGTVFMHWIEGPPDLNYDEQSD